MPGQRIRSDTVSAADVTVSSCFYWNFIAASDVTIAALIPMSWWDDLTELVARLGDSMARRTQLDRDTMGEY